MVLIQVYAHKKQDLELIDNWYLRDTVYPGILIFNDYQEAINQANLATYNVKETVTKKHKGRVVLYKETL